MLRKRTGQAAGAAGAGVALIGNTQSQQPSPPAPVIVTIHSAVIYRNADWLASRSQIYPVVPSTCTFPVIRSC